ncbi:hypothetical protein CLHUN_15530 [Ruminiclostridium hungatei]|uniref:YceG-like family protein n=1 Tax=Ruminiclostridium hungatei TaxID=48256 RepID=A0A1V4SKY9_RUMHU|nr:hypothetical protein [Ruminiclostridium hungatei]OPX44559.1 hypothetical protein CLHUN_15530 [Ruminiclostridium hungatei]
MKKVHEKSIVLGIGIGMIITAIAGLIYSGGDNTGTQAGKLSKEEIIRLAKGYGMIEPVHLINDEEAGAQTGSSTSAAVQTGGTATDTGVSGSESSGSTGGKSADTQAAGEAGERNINVAIKQGFDSSKVIDVLLESGVISNKDKFAEVLDSYQASTKIKIGQYSFRKNDDYEYIVKTICNIK